MTRGFGARAHKGPLRIVSFGALLFAALVATVLISQQIRTMRRAAPDISSALTARAIDRDRGHVHRSHVRVLKRHS